MTNLIPFILLCMNFTEPFEGREYEVYKCTAGYETIGVGHRVLEGENFGTLDDTMIDFIYWKDMSRAIKDAKSLVPNFDEHPLVVRQIIADLSFNLGKSRLSKFKKTLDYCINKDYKSMAKELKDSKWYGQVGNRSKNHVKVLRSI